MVLRLLSAGGDGSEVQRVADGFFHAEDSNT